jgi:hypothetical protein
MKDAERELSRKLADRFEPSPALPKNTTFGAALFTASVGGWWEFQPQHSNPRLQWAPRSYREPDRVVWMMKRLLANHDIRQVEWNGEECFFTWFDGTFLRESVAADLETASAQALVLCELDITALAGQQEGE